MIVAACLNRSRLWRHFQVFKLRVNMRVGPNQAEFSEQLLRVGEGHLKDVPVPAGVRRANSLENLIDKVYGGFSGGGYDGNARAVLTSLNEDATKINDAFLETFPGDVREYLSVDRIPPGEVENTSLYPTEYLNTIDEGTLPLHRLRLKIGC